jgi:hypothetical protein
MFLDNPRYWYWLASDGRIFASKTESIAPDSDPDYLAWRKVGYVPSDWPRDAGGNQTDASLQAVLAPQGMFANLGFYAAAARYNRMNAGVSIDGRPFLSDASTRSMLDNANSYVAATSTPTVDWKLADGTFVKLDGPTIAAAAKKMTAFVEACFTAESNVVAGIAAGTIKTRAQVDQAFAAISNNLSTVAAAPAQAQASVQAAPSAAPVAATVESPTAAAAASTGKAHSA